MRKNALFLLLICSVSLFAQWTENFADGNLTANPIWSGNTELFTINASQQLQLNASASGTAYLSTPSKLQKGTTWEFWVKLNFNPSQYNYCRIYLASDNADPAASTTGYFVTIGGASDKINLSKKTNPSTTTEIIAGESGQLNLYTVSVNIKVEFTHQSAWCLFVKMPTDADYVLKGEFTDPNPVGGNFFTINPTYTVSNAKNFFFDDINVNITPFVDSEAPKLTTFTVKDSQTLQLSFDEEIDISNSTFKIGETALNVTLSYDKKNVELVSATPFPEGGEQTLNIRGVRDLSGNTTTELNQSFTYWSVLEHPKTGDIVINEIMANPVGAASLPEVEYVEIYNNAVSRVNLANWKFYYGDKSYLLPDYWLLPDSFVILTNLNSSTKFAPSIPKIGIPSFAALANSGKLLYLENPQGELISFADYNDNWYGDDFKAGGGFSLECIDPKNVSGNASNWHATNDKSGGTPGKQNTVFAQNADNQVPIVAQTALIGKDSIQLTFSAAMNKPELIEANQYVLSSDFQIISITPAYPIPNAVILALNRPIVANEIVTISLKSLHSITGNSLEENKQIRIALSEMAMPNDIVINEILFNPRPTGVDFVELYNRSNRIIDLSKLYLTSKKPDGTFQSGSKLANNSTPLFPHEYAVFTTDKATVLANYPTNNGEAIFQLSSLPSLPDSEGSIYVINSSAEVIDGLSYSEKMHHPFVKNAEGVSLERINAENPSTDTNNWISASSDAGWATPGVKNSQQKDNSTSSSDFWLDSETITPDINGVDDVLRINFSLDESGYSANMRIYNRNGKLISIVANNSILGTEGFFTWNGTDQSGKLVDPGIYILYVEYHKLNRPSTVKKIPVVVGN